MPLQTATNPKTGERVVLVDNEWRPITQTATNPAGNKAYLVGDRWLTDDRPVAKPTAAKLASEPAIDSEPTPILSPEEMVSLVPPEPTPAPTKQIVRGRQIAPYKNRAEAVDDAVNMLEEGAPKEEIQSAFAQAGIEWPEIVARGAARKSQYFVGQRDFVPPGAPAVPPSKPTGEMKPTVEGPAEAAISAIANSFKRAKTSLQDVSTAYLFQTGAIDASDAGQLLSQTARTRGAAAPSEDIQKGMMAIGSAKTFGDAAAAMFNNPRATFTMLVDSLLVSLPTAAPALLLGPAGALARGAAGALGSGGLEYGSVMADVLQEKGVDLRDAAAVSAALSNPKILEEMKEKGAKRGLIVGAFDGLTMGMAGRFLRPAQELIKAGELSGNAAKRASVAAWAKELALQVGGGAGGEAAAQAATGEFKPADILLEGIAEGVMAPLEAKSALREAKDLDIARRQYVQDKSFEGLSEALARSKGFLAPEAKETTAPPPAAPPEDIEAKVARLVSRGIPEEDARNIVGAAVAPAPETPEGAPATAPSDLAARVAEIEDELLGAGVAPAQARTDAIAKATQEAQDDAAALGEESARQPVTEPSGESVSVAGVPAAGTTTEGVGVTEPSGVVSTATDVGQPAVGERKQPSAVTPREATVSFENNRGIVENESVLGGLRRVSEDDDVALENPSRVGAVVLTGLGRQAGGQPGRASEVLRALTDWADKNNERLVLTPAATGDLKQPELVKWYERNGFQLQPDGVMERSPVEQKVEAPSTPTTKRGRPKLVLTEEQRAEKEQKRRESRGEYIKAGRQVDRIVASLEEASQPLDEAGFTDEQALAEAKNDQTLQKRAAFRELYLLEPKFRGTKLGGRIKELLARTDISEREKAVIRAGVAQTSPKVAAAVTAEGKPVKPSMFAGVTNGAQAISTIIKKGNVFQRLLAGRIRGFVNGVRIVILEDSDPLPQELTVGVAAESWGRARGLFIQNDATGTKTVYLRGNSFGKDEGVNIPTVLHELLHAATVQKIYLAQAAITRGFSTDARLTKAYEDLVRVMRVAQEAFITQGDTGKLPTRISDLFDSTEGAAIADPKEFLAYGLTDPDFQKFLANIQDPGKNRNAFSAFVDFIRKLFGIPEGQSTALLSLIDATDNILASRKTEDMRLLERLDREAAQRGEDVAEKVAAQTTEQEDEAAKKAAEEQRALDRRVELAIKKFEASDNATQTAENATFLYSLRDGKAFIQHMNSVFKGLDKARLSAMLFAMPTDVVASWGAGKGLTNLKVVDDLIGRMHGLSKQLLVGAGQINEVMARAFKDDPALRRKLEAVAYTSTIARVDPSVNKASDKLNKMWDDLGGRGRELYVMLKDYYADMVEYYSKLLDEQINRSKLDEEAKKTILASIKKMYEVDKRIVPFFPLVRNQGELWISFGTRNKRQFITFKNEAQRSAVIQQLAKDAEKSVEEFIADNNVQQGDTLESFRSHAVEASDMLKKVFEKIDATKNLDDASVDRLKDSIYDLYLATLPEQSFRRGFIARKDVIGFNTDLMRNFSTTAMRMATQLSRIKYGADMRNALLAAEKSLEGNPDQAKLMRFVDEMKRRVEMELNPYGERLQGLSRAAVQMGEAIGNTLSRMAFVHYLSAAGSALVQLTSIVFAAANLGARHGYVRTAAELAKTMRIWEEFGIRQNNADGTVSFIAPTMVESRRVNLNPDERRAANEMLSRGVSEITLTNEMLGRARVPSAEYQSGFAKGKRVFWTAIGGLFHTAERLVREVTYMTSYRLSRAEGKSHDAAVDQAIADTYDSVGNMAQWNRPPILRGPTGRVLTQFMMYPLFITVRLARTFTGMLPLLNKEGKVQALKEFGGIIGATAMLAGTAGLPMYSIIMGIIGAAVNALDDEDKPEDLKKKNFELWFRTVFLPDLLKDYTVFGEKLSTILDRGPVNAFTGLDIASRTSLNDMWIRDAKETRTPKEGAIAAAVERAGPAVNMVLSYLDAYQAIADGDTQKAIEKSVPAIARGPVLATKYAQEGVKDFRGAQILSKDALSTGDLFFQAIGVRPDALANHQRVLFDMSKIETKITYERENILRNLGEAYIKKDDARYKKQLERMQEFNYKNPAFKITADAAERAITSRLKRADLSSTQKGFLPTEKNVGLLSPALVESYKQLQEKERAAKK